MLCKQVMVLWLKQRELDQDVFLGTLLAIDVPLLLNALDRKRFSCWQRSSNRIIACVCSRYTKIKRRSLFDVSFYDATVHWVLAKKYFWKKRKKKKDREQNGGRLIYELDWYSTNRRLEHNFSFRKIDTKFVNKPLSNFDLLNYVKRLGIKFFQGVFSHVNLPNKISRECGIVNLDDQIGTGTHWVCYHNIGNYCEYFDSFGLKMPTDIHKILIDLAGSK